MHDALMPVLRHGPKGSLNHGNNASCHRLGSVYHILIEQIDMAVLLNKQEVEYAQ